jgi:hypothetical protein
MTTTPTDGRQYIRKATTLIYTKDDVAAVCDTHIPLVESLEIGVGRPVPQRESLPVPVDCAMCSALVFLEGKES